MSRKLLSFGYDACHRWSVLRLAGFTIDQSDSIQDLRDRLMRSRTLEAVLMVEDIVRVPVEAIDAARSYFAGPVVLFEGRIPNKYRDSFDLRVAALTRPEIWLPQIDQLGKSIRQSPLRSPVIEMVQSRGY